MELLERIVVSRKTPGDGRILIAPASAARLAALGPVLKVERDASRADARLQTMTCTCGKGGGGGVPHVHHFVESSLLKTLVPGREVALALDEAGRILRVEDR